MAKHYFGWLEFRPKKKREADEQAYIEKYFPLGQEQRSCESALLKELLPKLDTAEATYHLLQIKEYLAESKGDKAELYAKIRDWSKSGAVRDLSEEDKIGLIAAAKLITVCKDIDAFPDKAMVMELSRGLKIEAERGDLKL